MLSKIKGIYNDLRTISYGNYNDVKKYRKNSMIYMKLAQFKKMFNSSRMKIARSVTLTAKQKKDIKNIHLLFNVL